VGAVSEWAIYVINLNRSPDRWTRVESQARSLGLPVTRVPATDGTAGVDLETFVDRDTFHRRHHALLRSAEVGCYASHLRVIDMFLDSPAPRALILEDDADLTADLPNALDDLTRWVDRWDIVKLNWRHAAGGITRAASPCGRLISLSLRTSGSSAYALNRHAAQTLSTRLRPMTLPYDWAFDRVWESKLRLRGYDPQPVRQAPMPSLISSAPPLDPTQKSIKGSKHHKPWNAQGPMLLTRLHAELQRVWYALVTDGGALALARHALAAARTWRFSTAAPRAPATSRATLHQPNG
jgi:glycosyl transferase, family 25